MQDWMLRIGNLMHLGRLIFSLITLICIFIIHGMSKIFAESKVLSYVSCMELAREALGVK